MGDEERSGDRNTTGSEDALRLRHRARRPHLSGTRRWRRTGPYESPYPQATHPGQPGDGEHTAVELGRTEDGEGARCPEQEHDQLVADSLISVFTREPCRPEHGALEASAGQAETRVRRRRDDARPRSSTPHGLAILPHVDEKHGESLALEFFVERVDRGQRPRAVRLPGGPEVEHHDAALEIGEADLSSVQ